MEEAVGIDAEMDSTLLDLIDQLAETALGLAQNAIEDAIARDGDSERIGEAQLSLEDGNTLRAAGAFHEAVDKYKDATNEAETA